MVGNPFFSEPYLGYACTSLPKTFPTMVAMTEIYRGLLAKIAQEPERVLRERVSLSLIHKLRIGWRATRAVRKTSRI